MSEETMLEEGYLPSWERRTLEENKKLVFDQIDGIESILKEYISKTGLGSFGCKVGMGLFGIAGTYTSISAFFNLKEYFSLKNILNQVNLYNIADNLNSLKEVLDEKVYDGLSKLGSVPLDIGHDVINQAYTIAHTHFIKGSLFALGSLIAFGVSSIFYKQYLLKEEELEKRIEALHSPELKEYLDTTREIVEKAEDNDVLIGLSFDIAYNILSDDHVFASIDSIKEKTNHLKNYTAKISQKSNGS